MDTERILDGLRSHAAKILEEGKKALEQWYKNGVKSEERTAKYNELLQQLQAAKIHLWEYDELHQRKVLAADIPLSGFPSGETLRIYEAEVIGRKIPVRLTREHGDYDANLPIQAGKPQVSLWTLGKSEIQRSKAGA